MKARFIIVAALVALVWAAPAGAHLVAKPKCSSLQCRLASQSENLKHARYVCHHGAHQEKRWSCAAVRWLSKELNKTKAALAPSTMRTLASSSGSSHWKGWSCITLGPNFNSTGYHEGNGYNGSYTGPLGMTDPWMGYSSPGTDWVHTPVAQVYAIAEKVAAEHQFSYSWMAGQWPQTFPPCSGYFN